MSPDLPSGKASGGLFGYACFAPLTDRSYADLAGGYTVDYGPTQGPRGCLRDSDSVAPYYPNPSIAYYTPSSGGANEYPMQNYCVMYQETIKA